MQVHALRPERDALEIRFPRVAGYRVELPNEELIATFTPESKFVLTPEHVGPSTTQNQGIVGESVNLTLDHLASMRLSSVVYHLTHRLLYTKWRDEGDAPKLHLFGQLKRLTREWIEHHLECKGGTYPALMLYQDLADTACNRITAAITAAFADERPIKAVLDPYNPVGSTAHVRFNTSRAGRWRTDRSHVNWVVLDSELGSGAVPGRGDASPRPGVCEEPRSRLRGAVSVWIEATALLPGLHRAGGGRPRRGRSPAPRGRDQGLPARGREGEEGHDGHLLGARREPPRERSAAGPSPS